MLKVLLAIPIAILSWCVANYFGKPILRFRDMRERIIAELNFVANISRPSEGGNRDEYVEAVQLTRRLGTELAAFATNLPFTASCYLRLRRYDIDRAARGLIGYSNSMSQRRGERAIARHEIEKGLKLPLTDTPERIRRIMDRLDRDEDLPPR